MKKFLLLSLLFILSPIVVRAATCDPGYYDNNGTCTLCPAGYACTNGVMTNCANVTGANGRPTYTDAAGGASSCTECPAVTGEFASRATGRYNYFPVVHKNGISGCYAYFNDSDNDATFETICYYISADGAYGGTNSRCQIYAPSACVAGKYSTITTTSEWGNAYAVCYGVDCMVWCVSIHNMQPVFVPGALFHVHIANSVVIISHMNHRRRNICFVTK